MTKVQEIMHCDFAHVPPWASVVEVACKMADFDINLVPVCDNGKFKGVVKERDITAFIAATGDNPTKEHAVSLVDNSYPMVSPGDSLFDAARLMADHGIHIIPVTQNGRLMGLLKLEDMARVSLVYAAKVLLRAVKGRV